MRKHFIAAVCCTLVVAGLRAQVAPATMSANAYRPPVTIFGPHAPDGKFLEKADIQEQFLRREWTRGNVKFRNGQEANNILMLFDVHSNKLYFMQGDVAMEFLHPIQEFLIGLIVGKDTAGTIFRSDYPTVDTHTGETFYEVIVDGDIQLLRCRAKSVGLYRDNDVPEQKRTTEKEQYYVYHEGQMVKIKKDKDDIVKALPKLADKINAIIEKERLKFKNEDSMRKLFTALNR
jgi:hypothetical protein